MLRPVQIDRGHQLMMRKQVHFLVIFCADADKCERRRLAMLADCFRPVISRVMRTQSIWLLMVLALLESTLAISMSLRSGFALDCDLSRLSKSAICSSALIPPAGRSARSAKPASGADTRSRFAGGSSSSAPCEGRVWASAEDCLDALSGTEACPLLGVLGSTRRPSLSALVTACQKRRTRSSARTESLPET
eukprot:2180490-Pleurochrysis_carterae.AAC.4